MVARGGGMVARGGGVASAMPLPSSVSLVTTPICGLAARPRITVRTLESLIFGEKNAKKSVRFAYNTLHVEY